MIAMEETCWMPNQEQVGKASALAEAALEARRAVEMRHTMHDALTMPQWAWNPALTETPEPMTSGGGDAAAWNADAPAWTGADGAGAGVFGTAASLDFESL